MPANAKERLSCLGKALFYDDSRMNVPDLEDVPEGIAQLDASLEVACFGILKVNDTLDAVSHRLVVVTGILVSTSVLTIEVEGVVANHPCGVGTTLTTIHALDGLALLTAVHEDIVLHVVGQPLLVALTVREEILALGQIIEGGVLELEGLSGIVGILSSLLAALRTVERLPGGSRSPDGRREHSKLCSHTTLGKVEHGHVGSNLHAAVLQHKVDSVILDTTLNESILQADDGET